MIHDFPDELYRPWCILYCRVAVGHEARLTNLLLRSKHSDIQRALSETGKDLMAVALELSARVDHFLQADLLRVYVCLIELENRYRSVPGQHRRGGTVPVVQLDDHRYFLRSPPRGYIVAAVPEDQRFTPSEDIGRDRVLGLRYRWTEFSAETLLDWDYSLILDALLKEDRLRVGFSPMAGVAEMRWHTDPSDRRGPRGEVPIRCQEAGDEAEVWTRVETALQSAYEADVHLLLFPELVMPEPLLARTMAWLETHNLVNPVLRLVVAGSRHVDSQDHPGEFINRCTVLDAGGGIAWEQDKRQGFTLETTNLTELLPDFDAPAAFEPTEVSSTLVVRETAIGRVLTSICLDYINEEIWSKLAGDLHLVPAMSAGLSRFRDRGRLLGSLSGSTSLVCNAQANGSATQRLTAYLPSKRPTEVIERGQNLFTLDIPFRVN